MIDINENNQESPICSHCKTEVKNLWFQELKGLLGKRYIYFCSNCKAVLGVSHRKGLLMG
jgi:hypothetical protein